MDGYGRIHHDETRHIGYGVWYLRETVREEPGQGETVRQTLRDLLPHVAASLQPPSNGGHDFAVIGATPEAIRDFALGGLTRRLEIIGVSLEHAVSDDRRGPVPRRSSSLRPWPAPGPG